MAHELHEAIMRALRDSRAYPQRGILVSPILLATRPLGAPREVLHSAIYTLFCAMPHRLVPDTTLLVATQDVEGGIELIWECREEPAFAHQDLHEALRNGPHGDLVDIAYRALETFCEMRAGRIDTTLVAIPSSPRFPKGNAVMRRVSAFLPASREEGLAHRATPRSGVEA